MNCPHCYEPVNMNATQCKCGFNFVTHQMGTPPAKAEVARITIYIIIGAALIFAEICIFYLD